MGHLVNPIAFRLGHTRSWEDNWYIKNIYYPEFLHSMLKIRHYLYFFWTTRNMEKRGVLLSHFYIYKFVKNLLIKIFLYYIDLEKNTYAFFAKGVGIFSDSFFFRLKRVKKLRGAFLYERYKPDLFFLLFLYFSFFLKKKRNIRKVKKMNFKRVKKGFRYINNFKKKKKKKNNIFLNKYIKNKKIEISDKYLDSLKKSHLNIFLKKKISSNFNVPLDISVYENKIKKINLKKLNIGFFDFLVYVFFKINMLEKEKEDKFRGKKRNKRLEMILNYTVKFEKWIYLLKKYVNINVKLNVKKKKSIKSFIFFLTFILNYISDFKKKSIRPKLKLKEVNLRLIRLFFFNKVLTDFSSFYSKFLKNIFYLLTNISNFFFKFCHITNNSVNAKFLARYIGLKLKRKFPLFTVINPLKKELRKLSNKRKESKKHLLLELYDYKIKTKKKIYYYKDYFKNVLLFMYNKYVEVSLFFYKDYSTFITLDFFIYYILLKKKFNYYNKFLKIWKNKWVDFLKEKKLKKKKKVLNFKWVFFLMELLEKKKLVKCFQKKKKLNVFFNLYIRNNVFINFLFGSNKYNIDSLTVFLFNLKFDIQTFFFFNKELIVLSIYMIFYNNNYINISSLLNVNMKNIIISNHFLKSYIDYIYIYYSFNNFINFFKINKKKYFNVIKDLYKVNSLILGYKMSFSGRFTRKQRASSIWFHQGLVPLNTIKGCIDYAFYTIPLKNSAISIKLWLYKNSNKMIWHTKFVRRKI